MTTINSYRNTLPEQLPTYKSSHCCCRCFADLLIAIWYALANLFSCSTTFSFKRVDLISEQMDLSPYNGDVIKKSFKEQMRKQCSKGTPRELTIDQANTKARKNMKKAILEHQTAGFISWDAFVTSQPAENDAPYTFSFSEHTEQGKRSANEDSHFIADHGDWLLAGVFDGHGGPQVSKYAKAHFDSRFISALKEKPGNIFFAFESAIAALQQDIRAKREWCSGSTAVVCFIDKKRGYVYTATLADSEALIFRDNSVIPLTCVRDFRSQYDSIRLAESTLRGKNFQQGTPAYENELERLAIDFRKRADKPRTNGQFGLNVSRPLGDIEKSDSLTPKCKITVTQLSPDDTLVIACDGLMDFFDPQEALQLVKKNKDSPNLAKKLVNYALHTKQSTDNVSVITIRAHQE